MSLYAKSFTDLLIFYWFILITYRRVVVVCYHQCSPHACSISYSNTSHLESNRHNESMSCFDYRLRSYFRRRQRRIHLLMNMRESLFYTIEWSIFFVYHKKKKRKMIVGKKKKNISST